MTHLPLSMQEDLQSRAAYCPNCHEAVERTAHTIPASLIEIFPLDRKSLWCSLDCLSEWISDRADRIARESATWEVDA